MHNILPRLSIKSPTMMGFIRDMGTSASYATKSSAMSAFQSLKMGGESAILKARKITAKQAAIGAGILTLGTLATGGALALTNKKIEAPKPAVVEVKKAPKDPLTIAKEDVVKAKEKLSAAILNAMRYGYKPYLIGNKIVPESVTNAENNLKRAEAKVLSIESKLFEEKLIKDTTTLVHSAKEELTPVAMQVKATLTIASSEVKPLSEKLVKSTSVKEVTKAAKEHPEAATLVGTALLATVGVAGFLLSALVRR